MCLDLVRVNRRRGSTQRPLQEELRGREIALSGELDHLPEDGPQVAGLHLGQQDLAQLGLVARKGIGDRAAGSRRRPRHEAAPGIAPGFHGLPSV
jgi:hypothetical protein